MPGGTKREMNEKIKIEYIDKSKLKKLSNNPRRDKDKDAIGRLSKLIQEHGFQNPMQVYMETNGEYTVLCGNHRFDAGVKMGMSEFPCIVYAGDRQQAIARAVSDNQSGAWTEWDIPLLKDILADFENSDLDIETTGFTGVELDELFNGFEGNDPNKEWDGMPEFEQDDKSSFKMLIVHFATQDKVDAFSELVSQNITEKTRSIWYPQAQIEKYTDKRYQDES